MKGAPEPERPARSSTVGNEAALARDKTALTLELDRLCHSRSDPADVVAARQACEHVAVEHSKSFRAVVTSDRRRVLVPVPFDPDEVWGQKHEHHVAGTVNGLGVRAVIEPLGDGRGILLGPAWRRDCGIEAGDVVAVVLAPEGPQRDDFAPDVAAAFAAEPSAAAFFDSIAQFYRTAYLRWIDATKRSPEKRALRIAEVVRLCRDGVKERPQSTAGAS